jgi:23S rRNA pseudouridine1911/1915/1917 synthase
METVILEAGADGVRIDSFLASAGIGLSRNAAQRLLEAGLVLLRGKPVRKNYRVSAGEAFTVTLPDIAPAEAVAQEIPLDVVYEDEDVIVVNKPAGLVVHPAPGHPDGTLVNALLAHCGDSLSGIGGKLRPGIVHRIDRDTSGLILAAKNDEAHRSLASQLKKHTLGRIYEALVRGTFREDTGTIDLPIGRHPTERKKMAAGLKNGRPAVTHWTVLERYPGCSLVQCRLETGRTHQIRVHMAKTGHPLIGDTVYGDPKPVPGLTGQCLHAAALHFIHPRTGQPISLACPRPPDFEALLEKLRRKSEGGR